MKRSDIITATAGALALVGYLGLIAVGEVPLEPGYVETLLIITLTALGYDTLADRVAETDVDRVAKLLEDLRDELDEETVETLLETLQE